MDPNEKKNNPSGYQSPQGGDPAQQNPAQQNPCPEPAPPPPTTQSPPAPAPTPPGPKPAPSDEWDKCQGVAPPANPGYDLPKPTDKECMPKDPCEGYYKTNDCSDKNGGPCKCSDRPKDKLPIPGETIRQQLNFMEGLVSNPPPDVPADATKKLASDLTDLEKEYSGLSDLVTKFETDRATIECSFSKARKWLDDIHKLCDTNVTCEITKTDIQEAYTRWRKDERKACCAYVHKYFDIRNLQNCQVQAERREADAKSDYELLKTLSKTFTDRLADLDLIFKDALASAEKRRFKRVCGLVLEFDSVWSTLFQVENWCFRRKDCCRCCPPCDLLPNTLPCWTVARYRDQLTKALKALIDAKYNRYLWNVYWLTEEANYTRLQTDCDKARTNRRARFLAEAEEAKDCPEPAPAPPPSTTTPPSGTPPASTTDCGCGKHQKGD